MRRDRRAIPESSAVLDGDSRCGRELCVRSRCRIRGKHGNLGHVALTRAVLSILRRVWPRAERCAVLLAFVSTSASCSGAQHRPSTRPAAWIPFRWGGDSIGGRWEEHSALYVPVGIEGVRDTYYLQLDTGAGWPRWYEVPLRQLLPQLRRLGGDTAPDELLLDGRIGSVSFARDTFLIEKRVGDSLSSANAPRAIRVIGTLGLRFFRDRVLVLDFPNHRLAIVERGESMPEELPSSITYLPVHYEHGYVFVPLRIAGRQVNDFFFDTGASSFALVTTPGTWRLFTGRTGREADNVRISVSSWGRQVEDIGAPVAGTVEVGPMRVVRPLVFHQREDASAPDFFSRNPSVGGGLIGNAMFADSSIVVIDLPHRRFGIAVAPPR